MSVCLGPSPQLYPQSIGDTLLLYHNGIALSSTPKLPNSITLNKYFQAMKQQIAPQTMMGLLIISTNWGGY